MAHRRGYSHHLDMGKISFDAPPLTPPLAVFNEFQASMNSTARKPRQYWQRTTFLALFTLVVVSVYVLLVSQPSLSPIGNPQGSDKSFASIATQRLSRLSEKAHRLTAVHRKRPQGTTTSTFEADATTDTLPALQLTPEQELAAVTTFLASLPQNVIPSNVDPSKPIDPQLVLDFDTRNPQALTEIAQLEHDAWVRYPVVFYSKMHSPISRDLEKIILELNLLPGPAIIPVEYRPDEEVLRPLLERLTGASELPILLVGGKIIGTPQEVKYMHSKGSLARAISDAGAIVDGLRKKKGRKH
ncbi:uncharacterized protein PHACADRAFT_258644 [Phanerochaete carnosa HHB-10118-sp]|uniref:Uncharacterized protein n=1 Tax=Phanerochaete carnosa (strain HHB-10118-sp) TaxID=650164 RepID=K5VT01_PHACS|nr:uncharacterized protein PHACADRAFT_258644 [Phanerochaete carnosa HHB-10118-sp]EKM54653.1 hypothetical protein PHACADRAFT_258644 [Phanerochaete carnosa HHB-10118-sp]